MKRLFCDRCGEEVPALISTPPWNYEFCMECYEQYANTLGGAEVEVVIPDENPRGFAGTSRSGPGPPGEHGYQSDLRFLVRNHRRGP